MRSALEAGAATQPIWSQMRSAAVFEHIDPQSFRTNVLPRNRPAVLKGLVRDWPAVRRAEESPQAFIAYLEGFCNEREVTSLLGAPEINGRFFYNDDLSGFNYEQRRQPLKCVLRSLLDYVSTPNPPALYAGAVNVLDHLPDFLSDHKLHILADGPSPLASLWVGNRTHMAAHWDQASNVIGVICGRRRYTLFPVEEIRNLYFGPLDFTLGGRPISLVDFHDPDYARHPNFKEAVAHAEFADLGPGDGLYIPNLWLHHAESFDPLGVMMNHWWQVDPAPFLNPYQTMLHSLLSIRYLPQSERAAWRALFDHYIFQTDGEPMSHLPFKARGIYGTMTSAKAFEVMAHLKEMLDRGMKSIAEAP